MLLADGGGGGTTSGGTSTTSTSTESTSEDDDDDDDGGIGGWLSDRVDDAKDKAGDAVDWAKDHASEIGTGVAIGVGIAAGAAFCGATAGIGCLALAGAAGAAAGYGTRVGLSDKESFSAGQFAKETAIGGALGAVGGAAAKGISAGVSRLAGRGVASAADDLPRLGDKTARVHSALNDDIAQNMRTTASMSTRQGRDVIAGGKRDLSPAQRAATDLGDLLPRLPRQDAEVTAITGAQKEGLTPAAMSVSRPICPACQSFIEETGGRLVSPTEVLW